jgi:hypothetical protein
MSEWTSEELDKIGAGDELEIAALRRFPSTYVDPMLTPEAAAATLRIVPR